MRRLYAIAAFVFALLLMPAVALAQPPGCSWEGDHAMRYGFGQYDGLPYNQPGNDFANIYPGATLTYRLAPYNCHPIYLPTGFCKAADTICFHAVSLQGWTLACDPPMGQLWELLPGYLWYQKISITAPCGANIGDKDTLIAMSAYANIAGVCAPECGDCADPNIRPSTGVKYYNADTLILTIVAAPPAIEILQDTLQLVERGQTQAHIEFTICNQNECAPPTPFNYNIRSRGHIGGAINTTSTVTVDGGACKDVYGVINAGTALPCTYDTLTIIAWSAAEPIVYDTCVQVVHVIENCCGVPVFTPPVAAILVLALLLAAAVFMRRRIARIA
jgi:hypothetical protein